MMFISIGIGSALAIALIVVVSVLTGGKVTNGTSPPAIVGHTMATLNQSGLNSSKVSAPWNSHHATVVVFFASWCQPCKTELPALGKYLATHSLGGVSVLGIDTQDVRSSAQSVVKNDHLNFPVIFDPQAAVYARFQLIGLPDTAFVTSRGVVQNLHIGLITMKQFAAGVAALKA
jgi:peroxiredoxin